MPLGSSTALQEDLADMSPPYRGLNVFDEDDVEYFFGREADVQRLPESLKESRFLAVLGASGSGKSSLVRAGLIPALRRGALNGSDNSPIHLLAPGARPLEELAMSLAKLSGSADEPGATSQISQSSPSRPADAAPGNPARGARFRPWDAHGAGGGPVRGSLHALPGRG